MSRAGRKRFFPPCLSSSITDWHAACEHRHLRMRKNPTPSLACTWGELEATITISTLPKAYNGTAWTITHNPTLLRSLKYCRILDTDLYRRWIVCIETGGKPVYKGGTPPHPEVRLQARFCVFFHRSECLHWHPKIDDFGRVLWQRIVHGESCYQIIIIWAWGGTYHLLS